MCDSGSNKRQRSANFSLFEMDCLVEEILRRSTIIENKRTDAVTWKEKEVAWMEVTEALNARLATNRTTKMLRIKYDGIKRALKQKRNREKAELFKTGGGISTPVKYTSWEERLLILLTISVDGLPSINDSDEVVQPNDELQEEIIQIVSEVDNTQLILSPIENITQATTVVKMADQALTSKSILKPTDYTMCTEAEKENNLRDVDEKPDNASSWETWTPGKLRTPLKKKLRTSPKKRKETSNPEFHHLAASREELLSLQKTIADRELTKLNLEIELLRKEDDRKDEKHRLELCYLKIEHEKKMELYNLKIKKL